MNRLAGLALKLVSRDWRSGELSLLAAALLIAVAAATAVHMLGDRLHRSMNLQASEFLGADLSVNGHLPPPQSWIEEARRQGLKSAVTTEFSTVLVENEELLLVGVKAVPKGYPLRGHLKTTNQPGGEALETRDVPAPGEVWLEPHILSALMLAMSDTLTVGEKTLRITRLIAYEPDRRGDVYSLSPRVLINQADLEATRVVQPGSHVHYYSLFSGTNAEVLKLKRWLKPQLQPGQHITDIHEDRPELGKAMERAERYLGLASIAVVLIAGVAIVMSARRYTERHYDLTAMLKCLGASKRDVLLIACLQFLIVGLMIIPIGTLAGWGLQAGIVHLVRPLLPQALVEPGLPSWLLGGGLGFLILAGFALPPVLRLRRLPPLRVLRRDLEPMPSSARLVYGFSLITLSLLMWRYTEDWKTTLSVIGVSSLLVLLFAAMGYALLNLGQRLIPHVPLPARIGLKQLTRRPQLGVAQILAFSITLVAMQIILLVRTELIGQWRQQLPADAPNHFALNLFDTDLALFRDFLKQENIPGSDIYPIVRGRLMSINGQDVMSRAGKDARAEGAINRELSLTWSDTLPPDNRIVAGQWPNPAAGTGVSMERDLAERLGVKLGDQLLFNIGGQSLEARVGSIRTVHWDRMTPNFYMIFSPGTLDTYPHTWLNSFYLPPEQKSVLTRMAKAFPGMTLLDVGKLLGQFQAILQQLSLAIEFILGLALAAGFTVLFATVKSTLDERIHEDTVMRSLGAHSRLLRIAQWVEFSALGLLAGLLSVVISESIVWIMYRKVLDLPSHLHGGYWLLVPMLSALVIGWAGYWNTRRITLMSPMWVMRGL
jgi:putative ABC transport system permease protein